VVTIGELLREWRHRQRMSQLELFPDTGPDVALDLVESRSTPKGVTIQVYRPTGRPQYETAAPDGTT
jgi:hypothetical protein